MRHTLKTIHNETYFEPPWYKTADDGDKKSANFLREFFRKIRPKVGGNNEKVLAPEALNYLDSKWLPTNKKSGDKKKFKSNPTRGRRNNTMDGKANFSRLRWISTLPTQDR